MSQDWPNDFAPSSACKGADPKQANGSNAEAGQDSSSSTEYDAFATGTWSDMRHDETWWDMMRHDETWDAVTDVTVCQCSGPEPVALSSPSRPSLALRCAQQTYKFRWFQMHVFRCLSLSFEFRCGVLQEASEAKPWKWAFRRECYRVSERSLC